MSYLERYGIPNTSYMNVSEPVSSATGFSGAPVGASSSGGFGGFGMGQMGGILGLANLGLGMLGQSNTARSFEAMQQLGGQMRDLDFATNLFAQNKDIFEQKDAPRWAAKFKVNDPFYRQFETRQALLNPGLAGRYSAFVA
jgi:hypothetical protein